MVVWEARMHQSGVLDIQSGESSLRSTFVNDKFAEASQSEHPKWRILVEVYVCDAEFHRGFAI